MFYWLHSFTQCLSSFFHQGMGSNTTCCTVLNILRWFNQMGRRVNGLARHSQQADMTRMCQSCGPQASGPCYADLIKWTDELTSWPDTISRPAWCAWDRVLDRGRLAHVGPPFGYL
jgi:hypothetical protein